MVSTATIFRLDSVRTRSLKTTYVHLSLAERRYIKLDEKLKLWQKELISFWRHVKRDSNNKASQVNDWDFYHLAEANIKKIQGQIDRFMQKHNWTEQKAVDVTRYHNEMNIAHCYGGSF